MTLPKELIQLETSKEPGKQVWGKGTNVCYASTVSWPCVRYLHTQSHSILTEIARDKRSIVPILYMGN